MSDPRPTARDAALAIKWPPAFRMTAAEHFAVTNALEAAFVADRAASDAREDRLREALEKIRDGMFEEFSKFSITALDMCEIIQSCAANALAAIPPRSDR